MTGTFTWRQYVNVRFTTEVMQLEVTSEFKKHTHNDEYSFGNAHLFSLPDNAQNIVYEESIYREQSSHPELIDISVENSDKLLRCYGHQQLKIFPATKSLKDIARILLVLRYELPFSLPLDKHLEIPINYTFQLNSYLTSLGCERESLNTALLRVYAPPGCIWNISAFPSEQLRKLNALTVDDNHTEYRDDLIKVSFNTSKPGLTSPYENINISLSAKQQDQAIQARIDIAQKKFTSRTKTQLVVFVCDLRGSSKGTIDAKASPNLLCFRSIWMRDREKVYPFRWVNIIGDMALIACDPESFLNEGLAELTKLYENVIELGLPTRGGFHIGYAGATGDELDRMSGYSVGEEFLGDAINQGAKVGYYKENEEGLLASGDFVRWFQKERDSSAFNFWKKHTFGSWETDLFSVDLGKLRRGAISRVKVTDTHSRNFTDRLINKALELNSRLIVGLDPDINKFPEYLQELWRKRPTEKTLEDIIFSFNKAIIEATKDVAVAYKPQAAFYEQYGVAGLRAMQRSICFLRDQRLLAILDAKRNDISHTAKAYADAWLSTERPFTHTINEWQVDAITVNGYLGKDGIEPFLRANPDAGLFILAKTSNPSSLDLQDCQLLEKKTVYEKMASLANEWGEKDIGEHGYSRVGLVVGATYPEATKQLRKIAPKAIFLMPGVGAQGGGFESIAAGAGEDKICAYASSSRSVLYSYKLDDTHNAKWADRVKDAAINEATRLNNELKDALDI